MKIICFILLMLPLTFFGQDDFSTRYYTFDSQSLPQLEELSVYNLKADAPFEKIDLNYFRMDVNNYRESVDMVSVVEKEMAYAPSNVNVKEIESEFYSFGVQQNYRSDGKTRVTNSVYKEMRGLNLIDPCPPIGVCPRCAPYRVGRGY
jgi:hypothetical protein